MIVHKYFDFRFHIKNNTFLHSPLGNSVHTKLLLFSCHKTKTLHCNWCSRKRKDPERMLSVRWGEEKRLCYGNDSMRRLIILMRRRFHWDHSVVQSVASLHFNITDVCFFFHSLWKWWVILFAMGHFQSVLSTRRHTLDSQKKRNNMIVCFEITQFQYGLLFTLEFLCTTASACLISFSEYREKEPEKKRCKKEINENE